MFYFRPGLLGIQDSSSGSIGRHWSRSMSEVYPFSLSITEVIRILDYSIIVVIRIQTIGIPETFVNINFWSSDFKCFSIWIDGLHLTFWIQDEKVQFSKGLKHVTRSDIQMVHHWNTGHYNAQYSDESGFHFYTNSLTPHTGVCRFFLSVKFATLLCSQEIIFTILTKIYSYIILALLINLNKNTLNK